MRNRRNVGRKPRERYFMPPIRAGKGSYERSDVEVGTARRNSKIPNEARAAAVKFEVFYHIRRGLRRRKRKQEKQREQEKQRRSFHRGGALFRYGDDGVFRR